MLPIRPSQAYDRLISYVMIVCYDYLISTGLLRNFVMLMTVATRLKTQNLWFGQGKMVVHFGGGTYP